MPVCKKGVVRRKLKTPNEAINIVRSTNKTSTSTLLTSFIHWDKSPAGYRKSSMPVFYSLFPALLAVFVLNTVLPIQPRPGLPVGYLLCNIPCSCVCVWFALYWPQVHPMGWVAQIKEYDELKRKEEDEKKQETEKDLIPQCGKKPAHRHGEPWTQADTSTDLGISQKSVSKSIQIAKAVEEYPELAASVDEIKDIRDKAEAIRMYLKQSNESLGVQNRAAEIKIRGKIFAMVKCIHYFRTYSVWMARGKQ